MKIKAVTATNDLWQTNIQGLRGVAIIAVLLFHWTSDRFAQGYLGVDIFFVISGYLMCSILNAKAPLSFTHIVDFYFRRIKRIIPTYLFVIYCCLFAAIFLLSPTDYDDLIFDVEKPLVLVANWVDETSSNYFAEIGPRYHFLLHLWSLCLELQFYVFVPFLVLALQHLTVICQLIVILLIALTSFCYQLTLLDDLEHMTLFGRIWQFMFGFLAWYLQQQTRVKTNDYVRVETETEKEIDGTIKLQLSNVIEVFLSLILIVLLYMPLSNEKTVNRLMVVGLTSLIIGISGTNVLLSNLPLISIGDISYSVYLIHVPLFKYYDYRMLVTMYQKTQSSYLIVGMLLIFAAILISWIVESVFKRLNLHLTHWSSLLLFICGLYAVIGINYFYLKAHKVELNFNPHANVSNPRQLTNDAFKFYKHFNTSAFNLTVGEQIRYNEQFFPGSLDFWFCTRKHRLPSSYNESTGSLQRNACVIRGKGIKNILVIGNSHSPTLLAGIRHHFGNLFKSITILFRYGCQFVGEMEEYKEYRRCEREYKAIIPVLRSFHFPIDIIVFSAAYISPDPPITSDLKDDQVFQRMQQFFSDLNDIAREVVLFSDIHVNSGIVPYIKILRRHLVEERPLDLFRVPYEFIAQQIPFNRRRLATVRCSKCVRYNFMDIFCNKQKTYCDFVDYKQRISFTWDNHHPSLFGTFFIGRYLRELYDQQMTNRLNETTI